MSKDLVDTKSTLEKEHKLVVLQMQAINELWKKVFIPSSLILFNTFISFMFITNHNQ